MLGLLATFKAEFRVYVLQFKLFKIPITITPEAKEMAESTLPRSLNDSCGITLS